MSEKVQGVQGVEKGLKYKNYIDDKKCKKY